MKNKTPDSDKSFKDHLLDALNKLDEFASYTTEDNDNGEAQEQAEAYDLLYTFINDRL